MNPAAVATAKVQQMTVSSNWDSSGEDEITVI